MISRASREIRASSLSGNSNMSSRSKRRTKAREACAAWKFSFEHARRVISQPARAGMRNLRTDPPWV